MIECVDHVHATRLGYIEWHFFRWLRPEIKLPFGAKIGTFRAAYDTGFYVRFRRCGSYGLFVRIDWPPNAIEFNWPMF